MASSCDADVFLLFDTSSFRHFKTNLRLSNALLKALAKSKRPLTLRFSVSSLDAQRRLSLIHHLDDSQSPKEIRNAVFKVQRTTSYTTYAKKHRVSFA